MAMNFPGSPTNGQTYAVNGITYVYESDIGAWVIRAGQLPNDVDILGNLTVATLNVTTDVIVANGINVIPTLIAAFNQANSVSGATDVFAFAQANDAYSQANAAFVKANVATANATFAYVKANTANITADLAYGQANVARTHANNAYFQANIATANATAAFAKANAALPNTSGATFAGNLTVAGNLAITGAITTVDYVQLDEAAVLPAATANGRISWNDVDKAIEVSSDYVQGTTLQVGQEQFVRVKNQSGETIYNGNAVMHIGTVGASGILLVRKAVANGYFDSRTVLGMATQTIPDGEDGFVTSFGKVRGLDTTMFSEGDLIFVDPENPGSLINTAPTAPNNKTIIGSVVSSHINNGEYFIRLVYGSSLLDDEHGEFINLANKDIIQWISANNRFENTTEAAFLNDVNVQANTARDHANAAYFQANVATANATAAFLQANVATANVIVARNHANAAFTQANVGSIAFTHANNAYFQANVATANATNAFLQANVATANVTIARVHANNAYFQANIATANATSAFDAANTVGIEADAAFLQANIAAANVIVARVHANNAYFQANVATANATNAFLQANVATANVIVARNHANAAFAQANIASVTFGHANNAYFQANIATANATAAFEQANTGTLNASLAFDAANGAFATANDALPKAGGTITGDLIVQGNATFSGLTTYSNTQTLLIGDNIFVLNADLPGSVPPSENSGFVVNRGDTANSELIWNESTDKWTINSGLGYLNIASNTDVEIVSRNATAAFAQANNAPIAFAQANAAYSQANVATANATNAFGIANIAAANVIVARVHANNAYFQANIATANATAAFDTANIAPIAFTHANNAYFQANVATANATNAFGVANVAPIAFTHANNAYFQANIATANATNAFLQANVAVANVVVARVHANNAYFQANIATANATAAFGAANTVGIEADAAFATANLAFTQANNAYTTANSAPFGFNHANNAYAKANAALANTAGITTAGALNISGLLTANGLTLTSQNGGVEGGEIIINGAGSYDDWLIDSYADTLRFITNSANTNSIDIANLGTGNVNMTIDGGVGIGTGSLASGRALTLNGPTNYYGVDFQIAGVTKGKIIQESTGNMYYDAAAALVFRSNTATEAMRITAAGDVGIGRTPSTYKLDVLGTANASNLLINGSQVLSAANYNTYSPTLTGTGASGNWGINITGSAATLTTSRNINGVGFNGSANILVPSVYDSNYRRITNPGGAEYVSTTVSVTGALQIILPVGYTNTMMNMTIRVFNYAADQSFDLHCGGYNYSVTPTWINTFAYIVGYPTTDRRFTVRFGYTAGGKACIYIGELASVWTYPQFYVTEVQLGYGGQSATWVSGWATDVEATAFENVTSTVSATQIGYGVSTNTGSTLVLRDGSGNFSAGTITATLSGSASTLTTARNINGTAFNGSAAITTASWGTARTLTIGSTGKSVDGSAGVSWSLAELGAAATNQTMYVGTTALAINRASASQTLTGVSIDGSAGSATTATTATNSTQLGGVAAANFVQGDGSRGRSTSRTNGTASDLTSPSGFYFGNTVTGMPTTDWWNWLSCIGNAWNSPDGYGWQQTVSFWSDDIRVRRLASGVWQSWTTMIHSGNITTYGGLASGTKSVFQQTAAPTGWTKDTTHNDKAMRIVSGSVSTGGSVAFSTAFASKSVTGTTDSTTIAEATSPAHTHLLVNNDIGAGGATPTNATYLKRTFDGTSNLDYALKGTATAPTLALSSSYGSGGGHTHTFTGTAINMAVQYVDFIIATKD